MTDEQILVDNPESSNILPFKKPNYNIREIYRKAAKLGYKMELEEGLKNFTISSGNLVGHLMAPVTDFSLVNDAPYFAGWQELVTEAFGDALRDFMITWAMIYNIDPMQLLPPDAKFEDISFELPKDTELTLEEIQKSQYLDVPAKLASCGALINFVSGYINMAMVIDQNKPGTLVTKENENHMLPPGEVHKYVATVSNGIGQSFTTIFLSFAPYLSEVNVGKIILNSIERRKKALSEM